MSRTFGAGSTADQVLEGHDLSGKVAVVTGCNSGLGVETMRALAAAGARVIGTARNIESGQEVADTITGTGVKGSVSIQQLDLADLASVRAAASALNKAVDRIDLLILNAGVMGSPLTYTKDGFEQTMGVNHFGHFALVRDLLPKMRAQSSPSRIVVLASKGHYLHRGPLKYEDLHYHRRKFGAFAAYAESKTANVLFAKELARRLEGTQVSAFSLHPGSIWTRLPRSWAPEGSCLGTLISWALKLPLPEFKSVQQGAATTIYAAVSPDLEGHSGAYLSDCRVVAPSKTAQDAAQAARLWQVTEEQIAAAESTAGVKQ